MGLTKEHKQREPTRSQEVLEESKKQDFDVAEGHHKRLVRCCLETDLVSSLWEGTTNKFEKRPSDNYFSYFYLSVLF